MPEQCPRQTYSVSYMRSDANHGAMLMKSIGAIIVTPSRGVS
jgi:hypothetical protein